MQIIFFEDKKIANFFPLAMYRTVAEFLRGTGSPIQHAMRHFPYTIIIPGHALGHIDYEEIAKEIEKSPLTSFIFVNSRIRSISILKQIQERDTCYVSDNDLVALWASKEKALDTLQEIKQSGGIWDPDLSCRKTHALANPTLYEYIWQMLEDNYCEIEEAESSWSEFQAQPSSSIMRNEKVFIKKTAKISPFAVLDARRGSIFIDEFAEIAPFSYLEGPLYVSQYAKIQGGKVGKGTSIGSYSIVNGEIENSIIFDYTNKYHDGFIGHSIIGSWVNIGAQTVTSDLKNNYSQIRIQLASNRIYTTNLIKLGSIIGDHSKTAIGTLLNSGTTVGIGCNVIGNGLQPKYFPSFCWGGSEGFKEYDLAKFLETATKVMSRRDYKGAKKELRHLRRLFGITRSDRQDFIQR
ncbi:MAG: hypothetical protein JXA60_00745 [Candidatus Coatesbacteria bacterium]|nr:hypothetical protein [Candidatus Coatesbacteria bacterium]